MSIDSDSKISMWNDDYKSGDIDGRGRGITGMDDNMCIYKFGLKVMTAIPLCIANVLWEVVLKSRKLTRRICAH